MAESVAERAKAGEHEEGQDELFPMGSLDGDGKSLKTLIKAGSSVKATVKMRTAEVPAKGGLLDPEGERTLVVTVRPGKVEAVPHHDGEGKVVDWTQRQSLDPVYVEAASSYGAGQIEAMFAALLADDPKAAGGLLDKLGGRVKAELKS
jgi:hypothetical protein